jgi:hypothetical protein
MGDDGEDSYEAQSDIGLMKSVRSKTVNDAVHPAALAIMYIPKLAAELMLFHTHSQYDIRSATESSEEDVIAAKKDWTKKTEDDDGDGSRSHPETKRNGKDSESGKGSKSGMDTESTEDSEKNISKN